PGERPPEGPGRRTLVRESAHGQLPVRAPGGSHPAGRATRQPALPGPEEQGDRNHIDDLRGHRESLSFTAVPEGWCEGPVRVGAFWPEEPHHRTDSGRRQGPSL